MKFTSHDFVYALDANKHLVHIDEVDNGDACGCFCPCCGMPLCAKNNEKNKREHHFAHQRGYKDCKEACESAIHMLAKEILAENKVLKIPNHKKLEFDKVLVEERDDETNLRPDCIGICNGKEYWVEFRNTHAVSANKIITIASKKINCIEIDLNECTLDRENLKEYIENSVEGRVWIYSDVYAIGNCNEIKLPSEEFIYRRVAGEAHCALDSHGRLLDLINPEDLKNLDLINNPCYCLSCGKPLDLELGEFGGYKFVHKDGVTCCTEQHYLWLIVCFILKQRFKKEGGFTFNLPCKDICKEVKDCKLHRKKLCYKVIVKDCELKSSEYKLTDVEVDVKGIKKNALLLSNGKNKIYFKLNDGSSDFWGRYSGVDGKHTVEFMVKDETDALNVDKLSFNLQEESLKFYNFFFQNYKLEAMSDDDPLATCVFSVFKSHKYHVDTVHCPKEFQAPQSSILTIFFNENLKSGRRYYAKMLGLSYCYRNHVKVCLCELCVFYNDNLGVCKLYKSGFPHYPLEPTETGSYPVDCKRFRLNKNCFHQNDSMAIRQVKEYNQE